MKIATWCPSLQLIGSTVNDVTHICLIFENKRLRAVLNKFLTSFNSMTSFMNDPLSKWNKTSKFRNLRSYISWLLSRIFSSIHFRSYCFNIEVSFSLLEAGFFPLILNVWSDHGSDDVALGGELLDQVEMVNLGDDLEADILQTLGGESLEWNSTYCKDW